MAHRQQIQGKGCQQDEDHAHGSRHNGAGMVEFGIERQGSNRQQDEGDIGIHDEAQNSLFERHLVRPDHLPHQVQLDFLAVKTLDGSALKLLEQIVFVRGDNVDELVLERLVFGKRFGLADRTFGYFDIPSTLRGNCAHERRRVVFELLLHDLVELAAAHADRMSRPGVCARGHGCHVGCFQDEKSR